MNLNIIMRLWRIYRENPVVDAVFGGFYSYLKTQDSSTYLIECGRRLDTGSTPSLFLTEK